MAIYNAYADRVPVYIMVGNHADGAQRGAGVESYHSAQDMGALVRDYVKWDDQPYSLGHFAESAVRAYKIAMTPPMEPVLIVASHEIQSTPAPATTPRIPKLTLTSPPSADAATVTEVARMLVNAQSPLIVAQRAARTPNGMKLLVELAETIQSPGEQSGPDEFSVAASSGRDRRGGLSGGRDAVPRGQRRFGGGSHGQGARRQNVNITAMTLSHKSNIQDFGHYPADLDLDIGADAEATLPALIEECKKLITAESPARDERSRGESRGRRISKGGRGRSIRRIWVGMRVR